jgi:hypothetical protein
MRYAALKRAFVATGDRSILRWLLTFIGFNAVLFATVLLTLWATGSFEGAGLSADGWIALFLGMILTSSLGVGLMALVFYSDRKDYDEDAYHTGEQDGGSQPKA